MFGSVDVMMIVDAMNKAGLRISPVTAGAKQAYKCYTMVIVPLTGSSNTEH